MKFLFRSSIGSMPRWRAARAIARQGLVEHRVVIARVVAGPARDRVGELVLADEISLSQLDRIHAEMARGAGDRPPRSRRAPRGNRPSRSWTRSGSCRGTGPCG